MIDIKNNFKKCLIFVIGVFCLVFYNKINLFAQQEVKVYINSKQIVYDDAKPQIINQRVMVPIRKTAELLGAAVDWNKTTEVMILTKDNLKVVHKMRSNTINVNGTTLTFDTPSGVVKDRLMMPVRMLSESLKANVEWENSSRSVFITMDVPAISIVSADKTTVDSGEKVTFNIKASSSTEKVKILDTQNNNVIAESSTYTTNSDGSKTFSLPYTPQEEQITTKKLKVVAGTLSEYSQNEASSKEISITVSGVTVPYVTSYEVSSKSVAKDENITFTIYANDKTEKIKLVDDLGNDLIEIMNYRITNGKRIFETTIKLQNRGERTIYFYPGNNNSGYQKNKQASIDVTVGGTSASQLEKLNATLTIHDVITTNDIVYVDEETTFKILTSSDINQVEVLDENEKTVAKTIYPVTKNSKDNEYIWNLDVKIKNSGRNKFTVVAYNEKEKSTKYSASITGESYSINSLNIISITQNDTGASVGDRVKFTVKTTMPAAYISVFENDKLVDTIKTSTSSNTFKLWNFTLNLTDTNVNNLKVVAYDSSGNPVSRRISVMFSKASGPKINEVEKQTTEVKKDDNISIKVYTNTAVTRLWVEDYDDVRVVLSTKYDSKSGDEYIWELKFPADKVGNSVRYTIYAKDENKNKDEYVFRVKVTS